MWASSILLYFVSALVTDPGVIGTRAKHNQAYLFALIQALYLKSNWRRNKRLILGCICAMASQIIGNRINSISFTVFRKCTTFEVVL